MILVDTSIWIDRFRIGDAELSALLQDGQVLAHPCVIGELALGQLSCRSETLGLLHNVSQATAATDAEALDPVDKRHLFGLGIGYVDAHLLAATAGNRVRHVDGRQATRCGRRPARTDQPRIVTVNRGR